MLGHGVLFATMIRYVHAGHFGAIMRSLPFITADGSEQFVFCVVRRFLFDKCRDGAACMRSHMMTFLLEAL